MNECFRPSLAGGLLLQLAQVSLGKRDSLSRVPSAEEWAEVKELAERQGLVGFLQEGLDKLPLAQRPPKMVMLQWIGEVLSGYEYRYKLYQRAIAEMAEFYGGHGLKMMVLKGYACSLDWPRPEHRPCGDIDIWQFGKFREADVLLTAEKGIAVDDNHHHHTVFHWQDFMVENHYDFINVFNHSDSAKYEKVLKSLGDERNVDNPSMGHRIPSAEVCGECVYLPSPNLHALFLIRHLASHFLAAEINLRQVLDWAFFVEKHGKDVDWDWCLSILDEFHMRDFFNVINAICREDLMYDFNHIDVVDNPSDIAAMKERVLCDILSPEFGTDMPGRMLPRIVWKYRRWKSNGWKRKLCDLESSWNSFWSGVRSHLLKPQTI